MQNKKFKYKGYVNSMMMKDKNGLFPLIPFLKNYSHLPDLETFEKVLLKQTENMTLENAENFLQEQLGHFSDHIYGALYLSIESRIERKRSEYRRQWEEKILKELPIPDDFEEEVDYQSQWLNLWCLKNIPTQYKEWLKHNPLPQ